MYVSTQNDKINVLSPKLGVSIFLYTAFSKGSKCILKKKKKKEEEIERSFFSMSSSEMII